jgi:carbon storage regulator
VLVFTRKRNDAIIIGDGIEVRVLRIGRDSIRLGVKAPPSVPVHRLEIYEQICEANRQAAALRDLPSDFGARLRRKSTEPAP